MTFWAGYHDFSTPSRYTNLYAAGGTNKKTIDVPLGISRFYTCFPCGKFPLADGKPTEYSTLQPKKGAIFLTSLKRVFGHHPKDRYQK